MKLVLALFLLVVSACSGPEVPSAYQVTSPASPDAPPVTRQPVAEVLAPSDPLEARAPVAPVAPAVIPANPHAGHEHHNHGTEKSP